MILHRHLKALLHRLGIDDEQPPDDERWLALLVLLNDRFRQFEEERHRLQRSLDIHAREVQTLYRELTLERDKLSSALACVSSALLLLDAQGKPMLMSAESETRLGWSEGELEGKSVLEVLGLDAYLPEGGLARLLQSLRPVQLIVPVRTRYGEVETEVTLQPLIRERQLIGCLLLLADAEPEEPLAEEVSPVEESLEDALAADEQTTEDLPAAPVSAPIPEPEPEPQPTAAPKPRRTPLRILVVESDSAQADDIQRQLVAAGHTCQVESEAAAALSAYLENPFDAVMCCEEPDGFSGIDLCRKLRQDSRGRYPYFILLTSPGSRQNATRALEAGVDAFLNKPLEPGELAVRLKVARGVQSRLNRVYSNLMPAQPVVQVHE